MSEPRQDALIQSGCDAAKAFLDVFDMRNYVNTLLAHSRLLSMSRRRLAAPDTPKWGMIGIGGLVIALFVGGLALSMAIGTKTTSSATQQGRLSRSCPVAVRRPSDIVLEASLATGAVLVLVGFLYVRISSSSLVI